MSSVPVGVLLAYTGGSIPRERVEDEVEGRTSTTEEERDSMLGVLRDITAVGARGCEADELERVPWSVG